MKALQGIKIVDFTHVQSGPTCTQLLGWFGADVIKVERPVWVMPPETAGGCAGRGQPLFYHAGSQQAVDRAQLKNETGKEILTRLIEECDVMVENFAPGTGSHGLHMGAHSGN